MSANARKWDFSYQSQTQTEREKQVKVVRKTGWVTKGEKILYSVASACLLAAGIYMVSFSSNTDHVNRELQTLEDKTQQQKADNNELTDKMKDLSRPERITSIAKKHGLKIQDAEVKQASEIHN